MHTIPSAAGQFCKQRERRNDDDDDTMLPCHQWCYTAATSMPSSLLSLCAFMYGTYIHTYTMRCNCKSVRHTRARTCSRQVTIFLFNWEHRREHRRVVAYLFRFSGVLVFYDRHASAVVLECRRKVPCKSMRTMHSHAIYANGWIHVDVCRLP